MWLLFYPFVVSASENFDKVLAFVSDTPVCLYNISYHTKIDARTIKKCLEIIEKIQNSRKIKKVVKGSKVLFVKEH